jgi:NADH:ubiquinone oxidoreductase subunit E
VEAAIIPVLQNVNTHYGYLPENVLRHTARALNIPLSQVYNIATFYNAFSLTPRGKHIIRVCLGTACYVKGGTKILEAVKRKLNVEIDGTTEDSKFSLETVSCLGCCGQSPVVTIDEDIYGYVGQNKIPGILTKYE